MTDSQNLAERRAIRATWLLTLADVALIVICCLDSASAQLVTQTPYPTGRNLGGVACLSPAQAFLAGDNHTLIETQDGGQTWIPRMGTGLSTDPFYTIEFPDALHGYVAGNNQDAYRTTDGGANWTRMNTMLAGSVRALDFITPTTGFAGYNGAFSWTPDGGLTWELRSGYPDAPIVFGMDFRDESVGLASGIRSTPYHDGGVYRTDDGGRTWTLVYAGSSNDVLWLDQTTALALEGDDVLRSDDAGLTWNTIAYDWFFGTGAAEIARAGVSSTLGAVSGAGDIWISTDLGYSWMQVVQGIGVLPGNWAIRFCDELNGWVVGTHGLTYRTTDGGFTWNLLNSGCGDEIRDLDFADENFGVAVTYNGFVFVTHTRGSRWDVSRLRETGVVFGRNEGLNCVDVIDADTVVAAGRGGVFFRSTDAGESWQSLGWPNGLPDVDIESVKFIDPNNGWIGTSRAGASMYRTYDGGFGWTPVDAVAGLIVAIDARGNRVWAATGGSVVHRSFDGGENWTRVTLPGNVYYLNDIAFVDENTGWAVGWWGYMARTTNGGVSWTPYEFAQNEIYLSLALNGPTEILVVGYDNTAYRYFTKRSTNGGASWTRTTLNQTEEAFSRVHLRPTGRFWLGGSVGKILYSPAAPLQITLPENVPPHVPPSELTRFPVRIIPGEQDILPGSETLWFRAAATAAFEPIALEHAIDDTYYAPLPALRCADMPQFYLSAAGSGGAEVRLPAAAPGTFHTTRVGVIADAELLSADFDAGLPAGWSTTGLWHVTTSCAPPGSCGGGGRAYFGQDSNCTYQTGGRVAGILRSPQLTLPTLEAGQTITLRFCSALDTEYPDGAYGDDDTAQVWWVSGSQQAPLEWFTDHSSARLRTLTLDLHAGRTGRLEWRFDSINNYMNNFRGWHVDDVSIVGPTLVCADPLRGDLNCDGLVNNFDVDPFVLALTDPIAYVNAYPACDILHADVNGDGAVNNFDVDPFVALLTGG